MNRLRKFLSPEDEPIRRYFYGVGAAIVALLIAVGVLTGAVGAAVLAILGAALVIAPAAEVARSKVTPYREPSSDEITDH